MTVFSSKVREAASSVKLRESALMSTAKTPPSSMLVESTIPVPMRLLVTVSVAILPESNT